jgi:DNA (cytosine-5)-methyltransferase 1
MLEGRSSLFDWPKWLPKEAMPIEKLLSQHADNLQNLRGQVDLLAGGPPCQGFSTFGRRRVHDPRNKVFRQYLKLVETVQPTMVLMENVRGITYRFNPGEGDHNGKEPIIYADIIKEALHGEYFVWTHVLHAKDYGVPQIRPRFILIGLRKDISKGKSDPFDDLRAIRQEFLIAKGLDHGGTTTRQALSDLCKDGNRLEECPGMPRFKQGAYGRQVSNYQLLMHGDLNGALADSHRFANHLPSTVEKFEWLQNNCRKGKKLSQEERGKYANKKHTVYILDPEEPAHTVTTLPDDIIHYSEPRILSVREMARLQSFPDWFEFKGKYTTGGDRRTKECPRYTQVGNAVPPLLAEALGLALLRFLRKSG